MKLQVGVGVACSSWWWSEVTVTFKSAMWAHSWPCKSCCTCMQVDCLWLEERVVGAVEVRLRMRKSTGYSDVQVAYGFRRKICRRVSEMCCSMGNEKNDVRSWIKKNGARFSLQVAGASLGMHVGSKFCMVKRKKATWGCRDGKSNLIGPHGSGVQEKKQRPPLGLDCDLQ